MDTKETYDPSVYDRPSVTVDVLFFTIIDSKLNILLIKRAAWPHEGLWALPGGFVKMNESLEEAAQREVFEECGIKDVFLEQLYTFGNPDRDPRTRVITVAYYALSPFAPLQNIKNREVDEIKYFPIDKLPKLAFDHGEIIKTGLNRIKSKIGYSNIVFRLLPNMFTLSRVQEIYEAINGKSIDKRNFRKWLLSSGLVVSTGKKETGNPHRPSLLYKPGKKEIVYIK